MEYEKFARLDDQSTFVQTVTAHFEGEFERLTKLVDCAPVIDQSRIEQAYQQYTRTLQEMSVLAKSKRPDPYKRAGALLYALYKNPPIVKIEVDAGGYSQEELESGFILGISSDDAAFLLRRFSQEYQGFTNEIVSLDLAMGCCQVYEPTAKAYDLDFMRGMIDFLHDNSGLSAASFAMIFEAFMA